MPLPVTSFYAALTIAMFLALTARVIRQRRSKRIAFHDGGDTALQSAIRAHANFTEYTPFALMGMLLLELQHFSPGILHVFGSAFIAGRLIHAYGILSYDPQNVAAHVKPRTIGMVMTLTTLGIMAFCLLWLAF